MMFSDSCRAFERITGAVLPPLLPLRKVRAAPDFSEARPYRRAGYIRPRRHHFLRRHDNC
jgi:hypothetical protein